MDSDRTAQSPTNSGRRRSSAGFMPAYDSLHQQKRSSEDHIARRQSMHDQQVKGGVFSQLFHMAVGKTPSGGKA
ncbi:hypothetical protein B0I35DRAFT_478264 [Stachybotrys elegans]|uniref:Uncharacterized protein n=1 Tax=Stachybotrys elegans TaxID=80388 RepID=A0A8K0WRH3_9HYPO|nr:hypothetical protein B0I35DRAFT_478264 [Stachybotrys elegans]